MGDLQVGRETAYRRRLSYALGLDPGELFNLGAEVGDDVLVSLSKARLGGLVLDRQ